MNGWDLPVMMGGKEDAAETDLRHTGRKLVARTSVATGGQKRRNTGEE